MHWLRLIWKNSTRNARRSVLTILSITVSIFLVSSLQAILSRLDSLRQSNGSGSLRVIVHHATGLGQPLPIAYKARIAVLPGVKAVSSWTWFGGIYIDQANFFANFAVDSDDLEKTHDEYLMPPDQLAAWKSERTAALVGRRLMDQYHWKIGDRVTLKGTIYPNDPEFIIRAVFTCPSDESQERVFFFHYDYFNEMGGRRNIVGTFSVKAATPQDVPRLMDTIDRTFRSTDAETKTETEQAFNLSFVSMLGNVKFLLNAISAAVVFTILLVAGNTMAMSIRERTTELAVLRALGFRTAQLLRLLTVESLAISLSGTAAGCLAGWGICLLVRNYRIGGWVQATIRLDAVTLGLALAAAVSIALLSTLLPAYRATRTGIADVLRYAG